MKIFHCLSAFLSSLDLCASLPGTRRTNGETPEEGGADTDCDGSPLAEDVPEVRTVPAGVAWGTALHQSSVFTPRENSGSGWGGGRWCSFITSQRRLTQQTLNHFSVERREREGMREGEKQRVKTADLDSCQPPSMYLNATQTHGLFHCYLQICVDTKKLWLLLFLVHKNSINIDCLNTHYSLEGLSETFFYTVIILVVIPQALCKVSGLL